MRKVSIDCLQKQVHTFSCKVRQVHDLLLGGARLLESVLRLMEIRVTANVRYYV